MGVGEETIKCGASKCATEEHWRVYCEKKREKIV